MLIAVLIALAVSNPFCSAYLLNVSWASISLEIPGEILGACALKYLLCNPLDFNSCLNETKCVWWPFHGCFDEAYQH